MYSPHVSGSTSTATTTTVNVSGNSQPELAAGQRQQGFFVGLSTTVHTPESILIPVTYYQQNERGLLSEIGTTQIAPFETLATPQAVTFDYDDHRQSARSLSLSIEPSRSQRSPQSVANVVPTVREKQSPDPSDKWIMMSGDEKRPFQCGYEGCGRKYSEKEYLRTHFVTHTGDSKLRCYLGECAGTVVYRDARALTRHIHSNHTFERPYGCKICNRRFRRLDHLKHHMEHVHVIKSKKNSPKPQSVPNISASQTDRFNDPTTLVPIVREEQSPDSTDKRIVMSGDPKKPFKCGYMGCGRKYFYKEYLQTHFVTHTGDSKLRCHLGDCAGTVIYRDVRTLTQHIQVHHTFKKPFGCELCDRRFRRPDRLKSHMKRAHFPKAKNKSPKPQSISESSSAATAIITATASSSTMTSGVAQSGSTAGQRLRDPFMGLSTTVHTPESRLIPATYYQQDVPRPLSDKRLLSDINAPQVDPFKALATHQTVTFEDQEQEQPDEFPLPFDELLQPFDDFDPMASEGPDDVNLSILSNKNYKRIRNRTTISIPKQEILPPNNDHFRQALAGIESEAVGITGDPKLPSSQHQKYQKPETDKWIILTGDKKKPFKCGYEGCDRSYTRKSNLRAHFVKHTGDSPYKCYMGECAGKVAFCKQHELIRHIRCEHVLERPYHCDVCHKRFIRSDHLLNHKRKIHSIENEKKSPKRKKK